MALLICVIVLAVQLPTASGMLGTDGHWGDHEFIPI
jgi:hypothetical protein